MPFVAVTGASGFIGSAVVKQLAERGRDVRALVEPGADLRNLDEVAPGVPRVEVDVCDHAAMVRALDGAEALYHLAAIYRTWLPDPSVIWRVNVEGTAATLLAAQRAGVPRVVYTSSIAAVGLRDDGRPTDESVPFNLWPVANDYILTKYESERIAMRFAEAGLPVVVVNPGFPFGPRDRAPTPTGKILLAVMKGELPALGPGGFAAIDVDDVAAGHLAAEAKGRPGERYLLANHDVTLVDFVRRAAEIGGVRAPRLTVPAGLAAAYALGLELWADRVSRREPPATFRAMRYAQRRAFVDPAKARRELGLPSRPLEASIERAIAWWRDRGMLPATPR
jgi:dihydroflavonol-4-reductase